MELRPRRLSFPICLLNASLVAASIVVLPGCTSRVQASGNSLLVVAVDRSGSTQPFRKNQLDQVESAATVALADGRRLQLWVFDRSAMAVWGPGVPETSDALEQVERKYLGPAQPSEDRHETRPTVALEQMAQDPAVVGADDLHIILLTDGDSEVASDAPKLKEIARALAARPRVRVTVLDILPENRARWQEAFSGPFGDRFKLAGTSEADDVLSQRLR